MDDSLADEQVIAQYGNKNYIRAVIGSDFFDPKTYADILKADGGELPYTLLHNGNHRSKAKTLPYEVYYDPKYVADELENIWKKHWQVACRGEDIPNVGDRVNYEIGPLSFMIVRSGPKEFKAFHNSCRHRGRRLCSEKDGNDYSRDNIQCPFHGWTYGLDGKLQWVSRQEEFPGVNPKQFSLLEVQCATWGGNVFINPDPIAPPLEKVLGVLVDHFKDFPVEERYTAIRIRKKMRINWKANQEAFMEGYHVIATHASGMPMFGSYYTQIDAWDDGVSHVSRLITPAMTPDAWVASKVSFQTGLRLFCNTYGFPAPPDDRGLTAGDARTYAAQVLRKRMEAETGVDYSNKSTAFLIDMVQWFMFPNFFPWWGEGLAWWYNFTPLGDNPNESVMEVRVTIPIPKNGPCPPSAKPVDLDFDDKGGDHPEAGFAGLLLDEDVGNMEEMQKGMRSAHPDNARSVISKVQENRIRHFHEVYAKYMNIK
jgi:phenylpropionate dioxygenase-like ring-hydroxylating dioxygenase large terminal subunit